MGKDARYYKHGRLPHLDAPGSLQFVTFRLADSLPIGSCAGTVVKQDSFARMSFNELDSGLDDCFGSCMLGDPRRASIVADAIKHRHGKEYDLHAWVVMPNHVHMLFRQSEDAQPGRIIKHLKMYTANRLNLEKGAKGAVWQSGYFDRLIRNEKQYIAVVNYIHQNPVKAKLVLSPESWHASSYVSEFPVSG